MQNKVNQNAVKLQEKLLELVEEEKVSETIYNTMCLLVFSSYKDISLSEIQKELYMLHRLREIFLDVEKQVN